MRAPRVQSCHAVSPDGRWLFHGRLVPGESPRYRVTSLAGEDALDLDLDTRGVLYAEWAPHSQTLALVYTPADTPDENAGLRLIVWHLDGRIFHYERDLGARMQVSRPSWSADGTRFALVYLEGPQTTDAPALNPDTSPPLVHIQHASLSSPLPWGESHAPSAALRTEGDFMRQTMARINLAPELTLGVFDAELKVVARPRTRFGGALFSRAVLSPDGARVALVLAVMRNPGEILLLPADETDPEPLASLLVPDLVGDTVSWTSDGALWHVAGAQGQPEILSRVSPGEGEPQRWELAIRPGNPGRFAQGRLDFQNRASGTTGIQELADESVLLLSRGLLYRVHKDQEEATRLLPGLDPGLHVLHAPAGLQIPREENALWLDWLDARSGTTALLRVDLATGRETARWETGGFLALAGTTAVGNPLALVEDRQSPWRFVLPEPEGDTWEARDLEPLALGEPLPPRVLVRWHPVQGGEAHILLCLPRGEGPFPVLMEAYPQGDLSQWQNRHNPIGGIPIEAFLREGIAVAAVRIPVSPLTPERRLREELADNMRAVVETLAARGEIDGERLAMYGYSYGGYLMYGMATRHPGVVGAFVAGAGFANPRSHYLGAHDQGILLSERGGGMGLGGSPWDHPERYAEGDNLPHFPNITEPILIFHGLDDTRLGIEEARIPFRALRRLGKPVLLLEYPGGDHGLHAWPVDTQIDLWSRVILWLQQHWTPNHD